MLKNKQIAIVTNSEIDRTYHVFPSIIDRLPWCDFNEQYRCFLLEDQKSLGVCFKIKPIPCEARPEAMLAAIAQSIHSALKNTIPCEKNSPWILQLYVQKETDLSESWDEIEAYYADKKSALTRDYLETLREHFNYVTRLKGIFHDSKVTNLNFRGGLCRVYAVLYRRQEKTQNKNHFVEILKLARKFSDQMRACGMQIQKLSGNAFYQWMLKWFNPKRYKNNDFCYPDSTNKPIGLDLAEQLFLNVPESFTEGWLFDGLPHKILTIQNMTTMPAIGHLTAERSRGCDDKIFNLVDHFPEGSVFVMSIVFQAPNEVEHHLKNIQNSAVGNHALALKVKQEIALAEKLIADGDPLFPVVMNLYLRGDSLDDLHLKEAQAEVLLNSNGFKVITNDELFPIDAYLRNLPMCYDFAFDQKNSYRSRYMPLSEISKLLPFYGRSRGTAHPGMVLFNRGGEPWFYDIMADKTKNAHCLVLGETGTGKSNLLNAMIIQDLALYQSRFFIIDAGGSFDLLGEYCKSLGLTVNKIKIDPKKPVSLNPFANGLRVIEQIELFHPEKLSELIDEKNETNEENESRDILGDMVLAALIMITGGEKKEADQIRRSDRMLIMDAIINAAYFVKEKQCDQMIASDIVAAFERLASHLDPIRFADKIRRAHEMADAMRYFINDPVSSRFFNSYGNPWELADITIIDMSLFANEGYEAQRAIAFSGCMNKILALAEINQNKSRSIKIVCDENHIITSIPLLADIQTRIAKMGRKLGLWLWLATQNLKDFADNARRMLAQIEHWICLSLPLDEIEKIEKFRVLTAEQRALCLSACKEKGKYTEGIILSSTFVALFRYVPPKLYLAMAATEQDEKNHRAEIMQKFNCSEIEAVKIIAREMICREE